MDQLIKYTSFWPKEISYFWACPPYDMEFDFYMNIVVRIGTLGFSIG